MHYRGAVAVSVGSAESDPSDKKRRSRPFLLTLKNYLLQRVGDSVPVILLLGVIGMFLLQYLIDQLPFFQPRVERKSLIPEIPKEATDSSIGTPCPTSSPRY